MSDYLKDQARSRRTLNLSKNPIPARTSDAEKAAKLYGKPSTPTIADAAALMGALASGEVPKLTIGDQQAQLYAALTGPQATPSDSGHTLGMLSDFGNLDADFESVPTNPVASAASDALLKLACSLKVNQRFKLCRDRDRPLEFDGRVVAQVEERSHGAQVLLRAAIYETRGGKFVTEMTRREVLPFVDYGAAKRPFLFAKIAVFESLDLAAMSFRTTGGRLTERLLAQIGDLNSEFIE